MSEFKTGQRVKVEYEGTVDWFDGEILQLSADSPRIEHRLVKVDTFNTKVTLLDPPDWPPQVGDIWEAEGEEWFAEEWRMKSFESAEIVLQPFNHRDDNYAYSDQGCYAKKLDDFKALNPVLVRRRGQ